MGNSAYGYTAANNRLTTVDGVTQGYDANGNMTTRVLNGVTWTQNFDAENRLTSMGDGAQTWQFAYDGDGNRVKQIEPNGDITVYVGGLYEVTYRNGAVLRTRKYYAFGIQIVAMRDNDTLYFLHDDNLYSTSLVTNALGNIVSTNAYYPFGASRLSAGARPTEFDFTGQRLDTTGLHFYNARYYDSLLGRFVSADTVVPGMGSQAYNRYAYVLNNPLKFIDPTGHQAILEMGETFFLVTVFVVGYLWINYEYVSGPNAAQHRRDLDQTLTAFVQSMMHTESTEEQPAQDLSSGSAGKFGSFDPDDPNHRRMFEEILKEHNQSGSLSDKTLKQMLKDIQARTGTAETRYTGQGGQGADFPNLRTDITTFQRGASTYEQFTTNLYHALEDKLYQADHVYMQLNTGLQYDAQVALNQVMTDWAVGSRTLQSVFLYNQEGQLIASWLIGG